MPALDDLITTALQSLLGDYTPEEEALFTRTYRRVYEETNDPLKSETAALGAIKRLSMAMAVKAIDGDPIVGGWAILYGDPQHKDRAFPATYFDNETELLLDHYPKAPLWLNHQNARVVVGERHSYETFPGHGVWLNHRVYRNSEHFNYIQQEIDRDAMAYSTDSLLHYAEQGYEPRTGRLSQWPVAGCSLITHNHEAEPGLGPVRFLQPAITGVAADNGDGTQAREAHGATDLRPKRDAEDPEGKSLPSLIQGLKAMTPEQTQALVDQLAAAFGVEPVLDAVVAALQEFISAVSAPPAESEGAAQGYQYDPAGMRAAFDLAADASDDDLKAKLETLLRALTPEEAPAARSVNVAALSGIGAKLETASKSAPAVPANIPYYAPQGQKSSARYGGVNYNRGVPAPRLMTLITDILSGNAKGIKAATKAQGVTENVLGGYWVRDEIAAEILKPLYNASSVMQAGIQQRPMSSETLTVRKNRGGSVAYWAGEHATVSQSDINIGVVNLSLKELVAENRQSRKALRWSEGLEAEIRDDLAMQLGLAIDLAALRGTGGKPAASGHSGAEPLGIRNLLPSAQVVSLGTNGAAPSVANLNKMKANVKARNVLDSQRWGWIMSTRERTYMTGATTTTGEPLFRENWAGNEYPDILGVPAMESNQVPTNITTGTNTDTSEIYLGDWQYAVLGIGQDIEIRVSEETYFRERDVLIQAAGMYDFGVFFAEAFEIITGVRGIIS